MACFLGQRLCSAAEIGDSLTVTKLLRRVPTLDVNVRDHPFGDSALSKAAEGGHSNIVRLLLEAGAQPNIHDAVFVTPLHLAAQGNHTEVVKLLLRYGSDAKLKTKGGMTAMDLAGYETDSWKIIYQSTLGTLPTPDERTDVVPIIPPHTIPKPASQEPEKGGKSKKKQGGTKAKKRRK